MWRIAKHFLNFYTIGNIMAIKSGQLGYYADTFTPIFSDTAPGFSWAI